MVIATIGSVNCHTHFQFPFMLHNCKNIATIQNNNNTCIGYDSQMQLSFIKKIKSVTKNLTYTLRCSFVGHHGQSTAEMFETKSPLQCDCGTCTNRHEAREMSVIGDHPDRFAMASEGVEVDNGFVIGMAGTSSTFQIHHKI